MLLQFRHGIVRHQIDIAGTATYVRKSGNGEDVDLVCDNAPILFTVAHSNNDYLVEIPRSIPAAWPSLTATGITQYLYFDISLLDASVSFGFTTLPPFVSSTAPTNPAPDQHWFDTSNVLQKVWNGTKWIVKLRVFAATYDNNATLIPRVLGSQVGLNTACNAGNIIFTSENTPIIGSSGTFVTTESNLLAKYTSAEPIKLEAIQLYAEALETISPFSFVTFGAPKKVRLAGALDVVNGIMLEEYFPGEIGNVVTAGLVRNSSWNFSLADINKTLFIGPGGTVSLDPLHTKTYKVGYIYDVDAIVVQLQLITDAASVNAGIVEGTGISIATTDGISTISLTTSGVTAGTVIQSATQNSSFNVDQYGRITSIAGVVDITPNWSSILYTPSTLAGYGITDAVSTNFSITPGTFTKISFDAKGLVTGGQDLVASDIPNLDWFKIATGKPNSLIGYGIIDAQPLSDDLTSIAELNDPSGLLKKTGVGTWTLDTNSYLTTNEAITLSGDATGTGNTSIVVTLANTGVIAGTYSRVTVDSKGRISNGSNPNTLAGIGISDAYTISEVNSFMASKSDINHTHPVSFSLSGGTGIEISSNLNDYTISLANTSVVPGTYNQVTVDSTGRVTSANNTVDDDTITLSGDITGSGSGLITTTLTDTGVAFGTYNLVTVDSKGRVLNASLVNPAWADVTGTPTSLLGYGITDTYTMLEVDNLIANAPAAASLPWANITSTPTDIAGYGIANAYTKTEVDNLFSSYQVTFSAISLLPTTLAGYGIVNAYTMSEVDSLISAISTPLVPFSSITFLPTTLLGYGITDAYTKTEVDALIPTTLPFSSITTTPTTLAGYGVTDAYTKTEVDALIPTSLDFSAITLTPTDLAGYGISNAYTIAQIDAMFPIAFSSLSGIPTTVSGYGITDAYTKTEVDAMFPIALPFSSITATPTTLAGYGITNALALTGGTLTGPLYFSATMPYEAAISMVTNDIDTSAGLVFALTLTADATLTFSNPPAAGWVTTFTLELTDAGGYVITWPTSVCWAGGIEPTLTVTGTDLLTFYTHDAGTTWRCTTVVLDSKPA